VGGSSAVVANEAAGNWVGINEHRFETREELAEFVKGRYDRITRLDTTVSQDRTILGAAKKIGNSFGRYNLFKNNCAQYASRVLTEGGVNTTTFPVPNAAHTHIEKNNESLIIEEEL
jgi:hypothetical protein